MARAFFIRTLHGLIPDGDAARDCLKGVKVGQAVSVEVTRPRNIQHHRLYWALCSTIADAVGAEAETISDVLKLRTGHVRVIQTKQGLMRFPKSIAFAQMDQAAFSTFFDKCCEIISAEWLGNLPSAEVKFQVLEMIGVPSSDAANERIAQRLSA